MRCIQFHPAALLPMQTQLNHRQQLLGSSCKVLLISTIEATNYKLAALRQQQHFPSLRTKAMHNDIALAVTSPAKSGDISVLLQTGGVLFLAYLFSNFVVPILITKYFGFDKVGEEEEDEDNLFKM
ncbi:hypothetical protein PRUPE_4G216700 [Prunus persica]|uniref:Uncharacterized protein n=1 Tax=Prunus persica TaxID=3760 RepID=A0A251PQK4_PRUPE|nr:uncharacterized protein LOC18781377 [Prunus persica]ONI13350.1 hypothetical protein PRUPE_4G216700 [Prunus persica]